MDVGNGKGCSDFINGGIVFIVETEEFKAFLLIEKYFYFHFLKLVDFAMGDISSQSTYNKLYTM